MEKVTPQQRFQIVKLYYENKRSVGNVFQALKESYGANNRPTETTIANTIRKFESQFTLLDDTDTLPVRIHPARSKETIAAVVKRVSKAVKRRGRPLKKTKVGEDDADEKPPTEKVKKEEVVGEDETSPKVVKPRVRKAAALKKPAVPRKTRHKTVESDGTSSAS